MYEAKEKEGDSQTIEIFVKDGKEKIGEFHRNYDSFGVSTFFPFKKNGNWYALYSPSYVALSIMELPSCKYIGGEDQSNSGGFCPVEVYVPRYQWCRVFAEKPENLHQYPECNHSWLVRDRYEKEYENNEGLSEGYKDDYMEITPETFYEDIAFVSGCVWGDDSGPWKIQLKDISKAHDGVIKTIDSYYQMARCLTLRQAVHLSAFNQYSKTDSTQLNISLGVQKTLRLTNDRLYDFDIPADVKELLSKKGKRNDS
jgi:hypothetical protein